jgi:hypothetical protein
MNTVSRNVKGYPIKADSRAPRLKTLAAYNSKALAWYKENEWQFNKDNKTQPPEECLCLSGGGVRSAAFSIGVMKGLHAKGIMDNIDIISGVSGGSFALSWYYLQQYGKGRHIKDALFSNTYQDQLLSKSRMFTYHGMALSTLGNTILLPVNILFNHFFSFNVNTSLLNRYYERSIRKTFNDGENPSFPEMAELIKKNDLPYFIVNTSVTVDYSPSHYGSKLANRVFEFTPLQFGSDGFGYSNKFPVTIGRAVSISGAAVDLASMIPGRLESTFLSSLNIDLGYHIKNYNNKAKHNDLKRLIPLYFLINPNDKKGTDIYLTDGGHSENLAMYSLVKRLCRKIIVVDAEFDPNYQFNGYFKLKNALRNEMQVELEIEGIEKLQPELEWEDRDAKSNVFVSRKPCEKFNLYDAKNCFDTSKPVLKGSISYFPVEMPDGTITQYEIGVTYIKLSIDDKIFDGFPTDDPLAEVYSDAREYYGKDLVEYYLKSRMNNDCQQRFFSCEFPHYTTWDQIYNSEQFKAYIDLGYHTVKNEIESELFRNRELAEADVDF